MKTDTPVKNLALLGVASTGGLALVGGATYGLGYFLAFLWNAGIAPLHWQIPYITVWTGFIVAFLPVLALLRKIDQSGD